MLKRCINMLVVVAVAVSVFPATRQAQAESLVGYFDGANCTSLWGWAADKENLAAQPTVQIYEGDMLIASVVANQPREDVTKAGYVNNHGFSIATPAKLLDGGSHQVQAYMVTNASNTDIGALTKKVPLFGSPKTVNGCKSGQTDALTVTSPAAGETWKAGQGYVIQWNRGASSSTDTVAITMSPYVACLDSNPPCAVKQVAPYQITESAPNTGSYAWTIPSTMSSMFIGQMRITVSPKNSQSGMSGVFTVALADSTGKIVRSGYVDNATNSKVEGWAFDSSAQPTCVIITYIGSNTANTGATTGTELRFTQEICPAITRTDAADWLRKNFGDGFSIQQPLGFTANPVNAITYPGTYRVQSIVMSQSKQNVELSNSAKQSFVIGNSTDNNDVQKLAITWSEQQPILNQAYTATLKVSGGTQPYKWQVSSGELPAGLIFKETTFNCITAPCVNPNTEYLLTGTPTKAGTYQFAVQVTDSAARSTNRSFTLVVNPPASTGDLVVSAPASGETWTVGKTYTIRWSGNGIPNNGTVTLELEPYLACLYTQPMCALAQPQSYTISSNVLNTGSFVWTVPSSLPTAYLGTQRVIVTPSGGGRGASGVFTVAANSTPPPSSDSLSVSSPEAGQTWAIGKTYMIRWSPAQSATDKVMITLEPYYACAFTQPACALPAIAPYVITENAPNTGSYSWTIPQLSSRFVGQQYITVSTANARGLSKPFTIASSSVTSSLTITADVALRWVVGTPIRIGFNVGGGVGPYSVSVVSGTVPTGTQLVPIFPACAPPVSSMSVECYPVHMLTGTPTKGGAYTFVLLATDSVGNATKKEFLLTVYERNGEVPGSSPVEILPGMVVIGPNNGTVYVITPENEKYGFTSYTDFVSRGYSFGQVKKVDGSSLDAIPETKTFDRPTNISFRYNGRPAVYYLTSARCKQVYPSMVSLRAWNVSFNQVIVMPESEQYPDCDPLFVQLPDNTAVRSDDDKTVYVVRGRTRRPFATYEAFAREGFTDRSVLVLSSGELALYSQGEVVK